MKAKESDIESSSDEDLSDSFHDLSDDGSNISLSDFRPVCRCEEEEAMAGAFLEADFPFWSGKWVSVAFATKTTKKTMLVSTHP